MNFSLNLFLQIVAVDVHNAALVNVVINGHANRHFNVLFEILLVFALEIYNLCHGVFCVGAWCVLYDNRERKRWVRSCFECASVAAKIANLPGTRRKFSSWCPMLNALV